jgi:hypothetical protein
MVPTFSRKNFVYYNPRDDSVYLVQRYFLSSLIKQGRPDEAHITHSHAVCSPLIKKSYKTVWSEVTEASIQSRSISEYCKYHGHHLW